MHSRVSHRRSESVMGIAEVFGVDAGLVVQPWIALISFEYFVD